MKKIQALIDRIDISKTTSRYVDMEDFLNEFGLSLYDVKWKIECPWTVFEEKVKAIPVLYMGLH